MLEKGLIQIYTSDSSQTNFVPMGLGLRAAGHHFRTHMTCFTPHELIEGAQMASIFLKPHLVIETVPVEKIPPDDGWDESLLERIRHAFQEAREALFSEKFDIVVLNGIITILNQGIVPLKDILDLMDRKPDNVELVLTGTFANETLIERANLVTEMVYTSRKDVTNTISSPPLTAPVEAVTGNGKGKTTYCLGKAMLMSCLGVRSTFLQFIKSPKAYGEVKAIQRLPYMEIKTMGIGFLKMHASDLMKKHSDAAKRAWEECLREVFSLKYGLIILDEINVAIHYRLIHEERVREMLFLKPEKLHLILSGRNLDDEVKKGVSSIITMKEIKHPFKKGIKARKGIEF